MKKYLTLWIPLLFFSIGCNDDEDDNDDLIIYMNFKKRIYSWFFGKEKFLNLL